MSDSWQQINDDGVLMDWNSLTLCDLYHPLNALRKAINERQIAAGISQTGEILRLADIYDSCITLHNAISTLIPLFVNHTDHSGNWTGQTTIPTWTEVTILAAIGDGSRIAPTRLGVDSAWLLQNYKIMNLLRWANRDCVTGEINVWEPTGGVWYLAEGKTWQQAYDYLVANVHIAYTLSPSLSIYGDCRFYSGLAWPYVYFVYLSSKFKYNNSFVFGYNYDMYVFSRLWQGASHLTPYYGSPAGYTQDRYNLVENGSVSELNAFTSSNTYNNLAPTKPPEPVPWPGNETGSELTANIILKFDGANGFKFKDW